MYIGRIVTVGQTEGRAWAGYRVSSRSYPNRRAEVRGRSVLVTPLDPGDLSKNPYIAYSCIRIVDSAAVVANGTQADMIAEKIEDGMPSLDAIALSLLAYGYERDDLDTPRLAAAIRQGKAWFGIAMRGELRVKEFLLKDNDAIMSATYRTNFEPLVLRGRDAAGIAREMFHLPYERPVCSAAAFQNNNSFDLAVYNPISS